MFGYFPAIRGSLMKRGWVEKIIHATPYMNPHPNNCVCSHAGWHSASPTVTPTGTIPANLMPACASHSQPCENSSKKNRQSKSKPDSAVEKKHQTECFTANSNNESNSDDDDKQQLDDEICNYDDTNQKESDSPNCSYSEASTVKLTDDKNDVSSISDQSNEAVEIEEKNSNSSSSSLLSESCFAGSIDLKDEIKLNDVIDNQSSIYETTQEQKYEHNETKNKIDSSSNKHTRLDNTNSELKIDIEVIGRKDNINTAMLGPYEIRKGLAQSINEKNVSLFQYTVPIYEKKKVKRVPVIEKIKPVDPEAEERQKKIEEEKRRKAEKEAEEESVVVEPNIEETDDSEPSKPYPDLDYELTDLDLPLVARLLRNVEPNLIWTWTKESISFKHIGRDQTVNRFPNTPFTTKVSLCIFYLLCIQRIEG